MTKNIYIDKFLKRMVENKYSPKSVNTYRYPLEKFVLFLVAAGVADEDGSVSFRDVTPEILEKYRLSLIRSNFSGNTVSTYIKCVKGLFAFLEEEGAIFANPARNFKNPRMRREIKEVPTVEEMERLLSGINATTPSGVRDRAMLETAYCCALRMNELLKLTIFNPDLDDRTIRLVGKGSRERVLPLGVQASKWLKEYMIKARPKLAKDAKTDALWLSDRGAPMPERSYQNMLRFHAGNAGLSGKITGHAMRRACATHMLRNGAHPVAVQHMLGHASLHHLGSYLNLSLEDLRRTHAESELGK